MTFFIMLIIAFAPLVFGIVTAVLFQNMKLTLSICIVLGWISIWQLDVAVLYGQNLLSTTTIEMLFRLLRIGTIMVIPSFYGVTYFVFKNLALTNRSRWMPYVLNRKVLILLYAWSVFVYLTNWTDKGIQNIHPIFKGRFIEFYYPTYGPWAWMFMLHLGLYVIIIACSFFVSVKVKDQVTRSFLLQFFGSTTLLYAIAILNTNEAIALFTSGIACLIFSICIFSAFTHMNAKLLKVMNLTLNEQTTFLRKILDANPSSISVKDSKGVIKDLNQSMASFYGTTIQNAIGKREVELATEEVANWHMASDAEALNAFNDLFIPEVQIGSGDEARWYQSSKIPITLWNEPHLLTIMTDITQLKRAGEMIEYQAHHDLLTKLPNRSLFWRRLTDAIAHAKAQQQNLSVMFLDLDRFKNINDTLGHNFGDETLKEIGKRLASCVHSPDMVARWGGDEFILLLTEFEHSGETIALAKRILDVISEPLSLGGYEMYVTGSIGISLHPLDDTPPEILIQHADIAMYRAKELGKNNYQLFTPELEEAGAGLLELENSLHKALAREEFELQYQPIIHAETGMISGMEALLRWRHPVRGLISPEKFIPIAEETGLIVPIGEWALREACKQTKAWQEAGLPSLAVSVNLSPRQIKKHNFVETVTRVLDDTGLDAAYLYLEITENVAITGEDNVDSKIKSLCSMGIRFSIDDFGTGYTAINYLKRFPVNTLKIDRSFVADIEENHDQRGILKAIIALAHSLKIEIVAEGVETDDQCDFLRQHGCTKLQGYLFSKPLSTQHFEVILRENPQFC
ncbi:EAL domain-containing protein [Paenibacillus aestuarii]|uniref:EAL domain-containing protein n=1 Tax=Paenibacillus aestuarii TaxID=516965 RepID=A0ABW0K5H6_9BACL|nr:EAL domain-containing protein [Paenibacillus aestuarii]